IIFLFSPPPSSPPSTLFPYTTLFRSGRPLKGPDLPQTLKFFLCCLDQKTASATLAHNFIDLGDELVGYDNVSSFGIHIGPLLIRSEEHTSELQSRGHLVCRLLLEKKK